MQIQKMFLGQPPHMLRSAFHWANDLRTFLRFTSDDAVLRSSDSPVAFFVDAVSRHAHCVWIARGCSAHNVLDELPTWIAACLAVSKAR